MSDPEKLKFSSVILDNALDKPLDYSVPLPFLGLIKPGMRVLVPVRGSPRKATVLSLKSNTDIASVKPISEILSEKPLISEELFALAEWIARYYSAPLRKVLKSILPPSIRGDGKQKTQLYVKPALSRGDIAAHCESLRMSNPSQAQVLDVILKFPKGILLTQLLEQAKTSRSPIENLVKKNILLCQTIGIDRSALLNADYFPTKNKSLNQEQEAALDKIKESLSSDKFEAHLIYGVTGSGKTEIYLQAIEHALSLGKGALLLVPEIALTAQTIERLKGRFSEKIAILHHRLSSGERFDMWHHIRNGSAKIVVGARSAVFSPIVNLGLILIDEEHEPSYKQTEEAPCYHARDVAVMRAKQCRATVVLGSATPSLESYNNALSGKYQLSRLTIRADSASLPNVKIIDMKREFDRAKGFTLFSEALLDGIKQRMKDGEQTLLFLNRRGYHTSQTCRHCSHVIKCPHCDLSLTFHLGENLLACHLCDYRLSPPPTACPGCHKEDGLKYKGAGTEQLERALHAIFPEVRTLRLDADTTRHKGSHDKLFKQFRSGKADVLIGTQMVAKGLHFPSVTLVGVLNADAGLNIPDFRASEHAFQLITQVSGRSGRGALAGEVLIQTHLIDHPTILHASAQDFPSFYAEEIEVRKMFAYPPFSHLVKAVFTGPSSPQTQDCAQRFRLALIKHLPPSYEINPVIPCGRAKVKDNYRFQFLIKGDRIAPVVHAIEQVRQVFVLAKEIRLLIDVDPLSTFF